MVLGRNGQPSAVPSIIQHGIAADLGSESKAISALK